MDENVLCFARGRVPFATRKIMLRPMAPRLRDHLGWIFRRTGSVRAKLIH
jgi:hypothetical protein